jgi:hypothetical protein
MCWPPIQIHCLLLSPSLPAIPAPCPASPQGTQRGAAAGFKLDTLLKLADVKGTDRKTSLLHFVITQACARLPLPLLHAGDDQLTHLRSADASTTCGTAARASI